MSTAVAEEKKTKLNQLDQLKKFTKVVADTADFESITASAASPHAIAKLLRPKVVE